MSNKKMFVEESSSYGYEYEEDVTVQSLAEGSEEEVKNNRHLYGVKKIANAGYGYWQHACQVVFQA